jgi:GNAT superfamily N-acetyltransferase
MPAEPGRPAWVLHCGEDSVGLLNLVVMAEHTAEAAVLVADPWQGQGVATRLVSAVFRSPHWAGWAMRALVQPDNAAARRVLGRVGPVRPRLVGVNPGQLEFVVDMPSGGGRP